MVGMPAELQVDARLFRLLEVVGLMVEENRESAGADVLDEVGSVFSGFVTAVIAPYDNNIVA